MSKTLDTEPGSKYSVDSAAGCTVSTPAGQVICRVMPGILGSFEASTYVTMFSDEAAVVRLVSSGTPGGTGGDVLSISQALDAANRAEAAAEKANKAERSALSAQVVAENASEQAGRYAAQTVDGAEGAVQAQEKAEEAQQAAADDRARAEKAAGDAETRMLAAQEAEREAQAAADRASADKAGAEQAKADALIAQSKAEEKAAEAEEKAAMLGDAALKGADNTFTGLNMFSALTQFPAGASFEQGIPWLAATAMAMGVPPLAVYAESMAEYAKLSDIGSVQAGQNFFVFAPFFEHVYKDKGEIFNAAKYSGAGFWVVWNLINACHAKTIRAITLTNEYVAITGIYRCTNVQQMHISDSCQALISWNSNLFSKAPDINIFAPNLTKVTSGELIMRLNSVEKARIKLPSFNNNFTLKIGAIQKDDVLYLLQNLPTLKTGVSRTAAISCDPALETDEDFLAQVAAFYDAETKTGWNVALTFQGNAIDAAATTYSMRRMTPPIFAMREECDGGAYVDADGQRWAIFSGSWVASADFGYTEFPNLEAALEEWGLTEYVPEVPEESLIEKI